MFLFFVSAFLSITSLSELFETSRLFALTLMEVLADAILADSGESTLC